MHLVMQFQTPGMNTKEAGSGSDQTAICTPINGLSIKGINTCLLYTSINGLIADKFVASFDSRTSETTLTAETQEPEKATASLETDDDEDDIRSFMHKLLSK